MNPRRDIEQYADRHEFRPDSGEIGRTAASESDRHQESGPFLKRLAVIGAAAAMVVAFVLQFSTVLTQ